MLIDNPLWRLDWLFSPILNTLGNFLFSVISDNKLKLIQPIGYAAKLLDSDKHTKASGLSTHQLNLAVSEFYKEYKVLEEHVCSGSTKLHRKSKSNKFDWSPIITASALIALKSFKVTFPSPSAS